MGLVHSMDKDALLYGIPVKLRQAILDAATLVRHCETLYHIVYFKASG